MLNSEELPFLGKDHKYLGKTLWNIFLVHNKGGKSKHRERPFFDFVDYLNTYWIPSLLIFFLMLIQAIGKSIDCLEYYKNINGFGEEEWKYAFEYCSSRNQYYVGPKEQIPTENATQLAYYHWVQIALIFQAALFFLPARLWTHACKISMEINLDYFIGESIKMKKLSFCEYPKLVEQLASELFKVLSKRSKHRQSMHSKRFMALSTTSLYFFFKLLYFLNCFGQFFIFNIFVSTNNALWGMEVLMALFHGERWQDSHAFPRLALCDVPIALVGGNSIRTIQCHLRINTYNEKIFLAIWWILVSLLALNLLNIFYYLLTYFLWPTYNVRIVRNLLNSARFQHIIYSKRNVEYLENFSTDFLRRDGTLLFSFISQNADPAIARAIFANLFTKHYIVFKNNEQNGHASAPPKEVLTLTDISEISKQCSNGNVRNAYLCEV